MSAPVAILELVARFERNLEAYRSRQYNETQVRREFLDPFFRALGWDVENEQGLAEAYKDVIHEDQIRIAGATKAPDYCFRIGGTRKFFVEAKKPSVSVKDEPGSAFQLRRYAWTAGLPLNILSNFEEFTVYDGRCKPHKDDPATTARIFYCTFRDYAEKWDWIASVFSREAVVKGAFDKYAESTKGKKGTAEFDEDFLATIEAWRLELARNLALRNPKLTQRELNFAVQRIIDRIIFLRICEDRGLEDYGRLRALVNGDRIYPRLGQLFEAADDRYNSGLFHFKTEPGRHEPPDELTLALEVDDKLLRDILPALYYPDSPYEFSVISADILGQVYERFLGKVIRLTEGHRAVVEEKPEVRKAGGVYYTPTYVVDYIVRQTVGELVEGKTPKQVSALRVLDPACGSGSFLIGAYQFLLDWHRDWYAGHDPAKWAKGDTATLHQANSGGWKLTIPERKRILLNNIFGVDIDTQAVEVTKLSLLLKVLEGETGQTLQTIFRLFHERALPDLGDNIKCGNSLIGPDFYQQAELPLLTDEERYRINVFDWHAEFPQVFHRRTATGELRETPASPFDYTMPGVPLHGSFTYKKTRAKKVAPPPLSIESEWEGGFDAVIGNPPYGQVGSRPERGFLAKRFPAVGSTEDSHAYFIAAGLDLARMGGLVSFIVPSALLGGPNYRQLRDLCLGNTIRQVINLPFDVFKDAYVDTMLLLLERGAPTPLHKARAFAFPKKQAIGGPELNSAPLARICQADWLRSSDHKIVLSGASLALLAGIRGRIKTTLAQLVEVKRGVLFDRSLLTACKANQNSFPYFEGSVYRYQLIYKAPRWIEFDDRLSERPKELKWFGGKRVLLRRLVNRQQRLMAGLAKKAFITNKNLYSVLCVSDEASPEFALGLLNSRLLSHLYIQQVSQATKDDFPQVTIRDLLALPAVLPGKAAHDRMVRLVEQMLSLHEQLAAARTPQEKTALARQIAATDTQIDRLVYDLYDLNEEDIQIVEGAPA
jgi:hypothetical protein